MTENASTHADLEPPAAFDYILCGSGPAAAGWLRTTLKHDPHARILLLERGPYCKTDVLTERNPLRLLLHSRLVLATYNHGVMQGSTLGGGTAVNNYAWVTPSYDDLRNALGVHCNAYTRTIVRSYEAMCEGLLGPRSPPHVLHQLLTGSLRPGVALVTNASIKVEETNRNKVFLGAPTLTATGERRSAFTGIIEPLWREHFRNLHIRTDTEVRRVVFDEVGDGSGGDGGVCVPIATGVETFDGTVFRGRTVVVAAGALETPVVLMRSGIGPAEHLCERGVPVLIDNPHVGQHLKDKMLLDDMIITDNTTGWFDQSLVVVSRIFTDGVSVQLHRYDKSTFGNSYLALTRLLRGAWHDLASSGGSSLITAARHAARYLSPQGYTALCFQTNVKMNSEGSVSMGEDDGRTAVLDASPLFCEVLVREAELSARVLEVYRDIPEMRDTGRIQYQTTVPAITSGPVCPHFRLVWHFAGTCRVGDVLNMENFSVIGTRGLHVVDMSACRVTSDGGTMAMAYMTGHIAAAHMLRARLQREDPNVSLR